MKKIILVPALLGVMGIGGMIAVTGGDMMGSAKNPDKLTVNEIEKKALSIINGNIHDIELESEGTKVFYEVEIVTKNAEYDLKFDAFTGELIKKKKEALDDDDYPLNQTSKSNSTQNDKAQMINDLDDYYDDDLYDDDDDRYDD